jgi:meso-butanediol dehydrogenase / (S,S)-butanediol dehydrogenase / diacetyl reductase
MADHDAGQRLAAGPDGGAVAIITGAGSGLGRATAHRLAREGYSVGCLDIIGDGAEQTAADIRATGRRAWGVQCDITDESATAQAAAAVYEHDGRIDVLVNAAGVASTQHALEISLDEWRRLIDVNLTGTFIATRAVLPALLESRGCIVNVSSIAALRGWRYMAAYSAAKGGIVALTRALAVEFGPRGVRVNCVCPGSILTPLAAALLPVHDADPALMTRAHALVDPPKAEPEEIAGAIAYLVSPDARFVTGAVHVIDGGVLA